MSEATYPWPAPTTEVLPLTILQPDVVAAVITAQCTNRSMPFVPDTAPTKKEEGKREKRLSKADYCFQKETKGTTKKNCAKNFQIINSVLNFQM